MLWEENLQVCAEGTETSKQGENDGKGGWWWRAESAAGEIGGVYLGIPVAMLSSLPMFCQGDTICQRQTQSCPPSLKLQNCVCVRGDGGEHHTPRGKRKIKKEREGGRVLKGVGSC